MLPQPGINGTQKTQLLWLAMYVQQYYSRRRHLYQVSNAAEDIQVEGKLVEWICRLALAPVSQAAAILGHHKRDAVSSDAIINQPAYSLFVLKALHDADLPESCCLQSTYRVYELICHGE